MAYANTCDAWTDLIGVTFGGTPLLGAVGCNLDKLVNYRIIKDGGENIPACLAKDLINSECRVRFMGASSFAADTATPADLVATFADSDGNTGTVTVGAVKPGGVSLPFDEDGTVIVEQTFHLQGALTYTISL